MSVQVVFVVGVVVTDAIQRQQCALSNRHDPRVAEADFTLLLGRVLDLDNRFECTVGTSDEAPVLGGIVWSEAEHDDGRIVCRAACRQHTLYGFRRQQRRIPEQDQHVAFEAFHRVAGRQHGMAGAQRFRLDGRISRGHGIRDPVHAGATTTTVRSGDTASSAEII